jgi:serine/threonine-protein kinase RsbT
VTGAATPRPAARVHVRHESDVAAARACVRELGRREGLSGASTEALATAVSEVTRNILVHAREGELQVSVVEEAGRGRALLVIALDRGPGIADIALAMKDGFTTGAGLGLGLGGAQRLVDEFDIASATGEGTTIVMKKWIGRREG